MKNVSKVYQLFLRNLTFQNVMEIMIGELNTFSRNVIALAIVQESLTPTLPSIGR